MNKRKLKGLWIPAEILLNEEPTGEIKAYKTDNYNNKLKGAEISLYAREDIKNVMDGLLLLFK